MSCHKATVNCIVVSRPACGLKKHAGGRLIPLYYSIMEVTSPNQTTSRKLWLDSKPHTLTGGDFLSDVHFSNLVSARLQFYGRVQPLTLTCQTLETAFIQPYTTYTFLEVLIKRLEPLQDGEWMLFFVKRRVSLQSG